MSELSMIDRIRKNAELVVATAREQLDEEIGYDEAGVRWLDGYIQRQHERGNRASFEGLVSTLGSYLGECIVQSFGGSWAQDESGWCVRFAQGNAAFPFNKVSKQLENGAEDSVLSFFTAIPLVVQRS